MPTPIQAFQIKSEDTKDLKTPFDDDYEDAAIMSTEFISDYSFEASEGASIVSTEITDIEITDAK